MRPLTALRFAIALPRLDVAPLQWAALGIVLFVSAVALPNSVGSENVDEGWMQLLTRLGPARAGVDYIFPYGPLFYLVISPYEATQFLQKFAIELAGKGAMTLLILRLARRLPAMTGTLWVLAISALMLAFPQQIEFAMLAAAAALLVPLLRERIAPADLAIAAIYLAAVSLAKFTICTFALGGLGVLSILLAAERPRWRALLPFTIYTAALAAFFALCGQRLLDLPAFFAAGFAYSAAYTEGLAVVGPALEVRLGLIVFALMLFAFLSAGRSVVLKPRTLAKAAIIAILAAIYWKAGFVRHDGHAVATFTILLLLPTLVGLAVGESPRLETRRGLIALATFLAGLGLLEVLIRERMLAKLLDTSLLSRWPERARQIAHPGEVQAKLEHALQAARKQCDLPGIREIVGGEAIDVFTDCQGVAILNGLRIAPRPTLQSVNAVHPDWLWANAATLHGDGAPRFLLVKWASFDGRYPTLTDGPALLAIIQNYEVRCEEKGFLLLKRRSAPRAAEPELVLDRTASLHEVIELPPIARGEYLSLTLDLRMTAWGTLRTAAYQPPVYFFLVRDLTGRWQSYRLIAPIARTEFLLNPLCENNADLKTLLETGTGRQVTAILLLVQHGELNRIKPSFSLQVRRYR